VTTTVLDQELDLSDLDVLDDEHAHVFCHRCTPGPGVYPARCGKRAFCRYYRIADVGIPPNVCLDCLDIPCQRCV
jgi:hypothetical protein